MLQKLVAGLETLEDELKPESTPWYTEKWLSSVISGAFLNFTILILLFY